MTARRKLLRSLRVLVILGALGGVIYVVAWSHLLVVKQISITGTTSSNAIMLILQENKPPVHVGEPLARVDVNLIDRELRGVNWIGATKISRSWLHGTLGIEITPRVAVARFIDANGVVNYFDASGAVFDHFEGNENLPVVSLANQSPELKSAVATLLSALTPELLNEATSFKARSVDDLQMTIHSTALKRDLTIKWGDKNYLDLKLKVLQKLFTLPDDKKIHIFDISTPLAPITK